MLPHWSNGGSGTGRQKTLRVARRYRDGRLHSIDRFVHHVEEVAEGIDALVLDVKVGSGAFMKSLDDARELARTMVGIGAHMNKNVVARLTNMDQPLGEKIGNTLEVIESLDVLSGGGPQDVVQLTVELGAEMLVAGKQANDMAAARAQLTEVLQNGKALEKFAEIIEAQHGDPRVIDDRKRLPLSQKRVTFSASQTGFLAQVDTEKSVWRRWFWGAAGKRLPDAVDPSVGLEVHAELGDAIKPGQPLVTIHHQERGLDACLKILEQAFSISDSPIEKPELFIDRIDEHSL